MAVVLADHSKGWADEFRAETSRLKVVLGSNLAAVHHIGSTSVPGLLAKPIIDIMGEVKSLEGCDDASAQMELLGYEVMGAHGISGRRYYRKFNSARQRTHHLHVFEQGAHAVLRHLALRDYLIAHRDVADDYAALKRKLTAIDNGDWDMYVSGKDRFIKDAEARALAWWRHHRR